MCGRAYSTFTEQELFYRYLNQKPVEFPEIKPNYNMAPTHMVPVLRNINGERRFDLMRWGLIPGWAKDLESIKKYSLINAKAEEIQTKKSYADAFLKRRCILPLSGFVEWSQNVEPKRPFCIHLKHNELMSLAGVWEKWKSLDGQPDLFSFAIITTAANELVSNIHNRMPVILKKSDEEAWLDPNLHDVAKLKTFLRPYDSSEMNLYEVSTKINSPRNNSKELLDPVT